MTVQVNTEKNQGYISTDKIIEALDSGIDPQDIETKFVNDFNISIDEARSAIEKARENKINSMTQATDESATQIDTGIEQVSTQINEGIEQVSTQVDSNVALDTGIPTTDVATTQPITFWGVDIPLGDPTSDVEKLDTSELLASINAYKRETIDFATLIRGGFSDEAQAKVAMDLEKLKKAQVEIARNNGIPLVFNPENNQVGQLTEDGQFVEMNSEILDDLYAEKFEIMGSIFGGFKGAQKGFAMAPPVAPLVGPLSKPIAGIFGGIVGGYTGAFPGRGADIVAAADTLELIDKLEFKQVVGQMHQAGIDDATFTSVIGPIANAAFKTIGKAWHAVKDGDSLGARRALKDVMGIGQEKIDEVVELFERYTVNAAKKTGTKTQQEIEAIGMTQPGGEVFVEPALKLDTTAGARVTKVITDRANDVLDKAASLSTDNVVTVIKDDLGEYVSKVKKFFGDTRQHAIDKVPTSYSFDYEKLAIKPLLDKIESNITNPNVLESFKLHVAKARLLGTTATKTVAKKKGDDVVTDIRPGPLDATGEKIYPKGTTIDLAENLRSFENLLELRQTINDFKFNKKLGSVINSKAIDDVINKIDKEIAAVTKANMTDASSWKAQWRRSNTEYAKMKALEENVIFKALNVKGVEPEKVIKLFSNKITSPDGVFMDVIKRLPHNTRIKMEGAVLEHVTNKFTAGIPGGARATHFPMLADELDKIAFVTPEARHFKRVIKQLSEVWKNDVNLSKATGNISVPRFQSFLTADPVMRAKYEFAS